MADTASAAIVIDAPAEAVMAVIADFAAYPEWAGSVKRTEVLETGEDGRARTVRIVLDAGVVKDDYVLSYAWEGQQSVSWHLVSAQVQKAQDGRYTLTPTADGAGTDVRYELAVELGIPMPGLLKRRAEKMVMDTALRDLKRRVERTAG